MKMKVQPLINGKIPGPGRRRLRLPGVHGWASAAAPSRTLGWLLAMRMIMVPACSNRLFFKLIGGLEHFLFFHIGNNHPK